MQKNLIQNISIAIPSYKSEFIHLVIERALSFGFEEIIIVDSSPQLPKIVSDQRVKCLWQKERMLPGAARNLAASHCTREWILFLDSDVLLTESGITHLINFLLEEKKRNIIIWGLYLVDSNKNIWTNIQNKILKYRFGFLSQRNIQGQFGQSSHVVISKSWFDKIGGFNPFLRMREDTELACRSSVFGGDQIFLNHFGAIHLKEFTYFGLVSDYFNRTFLSMSAELSLPKLFLNRNPMISASLLLQWTMPLFFLSIIISFGLNSVSLIIISIIWALSFGIFYYSARLAISLKDLLLIQLFLPGLSLGLFSGAFMAFAVRGINLMRDYSNKLITLFSVIFKILKLDGSPIQLTHFVTNRCNLRCSHCFYTDTLNLPPAEISLDHASNLYESSGRLLWLALAGGEVLSRRDVSDLISVAIKKANPMLITIPTNGYFTQHIFHTILRLAQEHPNQKFSIQISVDGDRETHDQIRGLGSYERAVETARMLGRLRKVYSNLNLSLITVVCAENAALFPQALDHMSNEFATDQIHINLFRHGSLGAPRISQNLIEKYREAIVYNFERVKNINVRGYGYLTFKIVNYISSAQKKLIYKTARDHKNYINCRAGTLSYTVWENGNVSPCELRKERFSFKNYSNFWKSKELTNVRKCISDEKCFCSYECAMTINVLDPRNRNSTLDN